MEGEASMDCGDPIEPPLTLCTLPKDVASAIFARCDVAGIGRTASSSRACQAMCEKDDGIWYDICARQGLDTDVRPKDAIRRAASCSHDDRPSNDYEWEQGTSRCRCRSCRRPFQVTMQNGFVDTKMFSSKIVTRAEFVATHEAPRRFRKFSINWSRPNAAAARAAGVELVNKRNTRGSFALPKFPPPTR